MATSLIEYMYGYPLVILPYLFGLRAYVKADETGWLDLASLVFGGMAVVAPLLSFYSGRSVVGPGPLLVFLGALGAIVCFFALLFEKYEKPSAHCRTGSVITAIGLGWYTVCMGMITAG